MRLSPLMIVPMLALMALPGAARAQSVGVASAVDQSALGTAPSEKPRTMVLGDRIIHNEKIETNGKGLLQILLADGTSFTVGPNSTMSIDSFVYNPDANTAKVVATLGKGVFRFIGGRTSKTPDGAQLNTLVGSVGIQGGIGDFDFSGKGKPFHIDMLFGNSIILTDHGTVIGHIFQNGYSIVFGPNHSVSIVKTPPGWTQSFQHDVTSHGDQHGGAPHGARSTIETAFRESTTSTTPTPASGSNGESTTQFVASTQPSPPSSPSLASATWDEINNSSLANTEATYLGTYAINYTATGTGAVGVIGGGSASSGTLTGDFSLDYHFGDDNGGGTLSFLQTGSAPYTLPVNPLSTGGGSATFGYAASTETPISYSDVTGTQHEDVAVSGAFQDTAAGVGHGVGGSVSFDVLTQLSEDGGPVSTGTASGSGTFGGSLDHTTP